MSDDPDGPIEIELTSHAPTRGRRRGRTAPADADRPATVPETASLPPTDDAPSTGVTTTGSGWLDSERSRLLVTASAVAVVALLLGWMLGRSGGDSGALGDSPTPTSQANGFGDERDTGDDDQDDDPVFEGAEELPDPDARFDDLIVNDTVTPPVTIPAVTPVTSTTTIARSSAGGRAPAEITIDERVLGVEMDLLAIDAQRRLVEVDLATGTATIRGEQFIVAPDQMIAGPGWVVATGYNSQSFTIDFDDAGRTSIQVPDPWSLMVDRVQSRFWSRSSVRIDTPVFDEYTFDGQPTGRSVDLPSFGWPQTIDDGAIVTTSVGSVFRIAPEGHEVIARGELIELSADVAVVNTCDDDLRCGMSVIDRATGEQRWVPLVGDDGEPVNDYPINARYGRADGSLSPDGTRMAVARSSNFGEVIGILDLASGAFTDVSGVSIAEHWTWGPNGRFAFFLEGRLPMVNDTETNETFPLSLDQLSWVTLTGRPSVVIG